MEKITSKENSRIKAYAKLAASRKERQRQGAFVLEGEKLLAEALRCGAEIQSVFVGERWLARSGESLPSAILENCILVSEGVEQRLAQSQTPQGVYAVCSMLDNPVNLAKMEEGGCLLGLWDLQDPGNVGTMIRTADAMGMDGVVLSRECCDLYSLKTLRAAMGSTFRMPLLVTDMAEFLGESGFVSFAAVVGEAEPLGKLQFPKKSIIVIGNEGNGLSPEQVSCCSRRVTIPMKGRAESLNAAMAAAILMWEASSRGSTGVRCGKQSLPDSFSAF